MKRFKCLVHLNAKVSLGAIVMGLFRWSKDKCFPYGEEKVNGEIPASFPEHDLRPVREDHISRLGVHFDWVKECSRCGIEYLGGDPSLEGEEYETEKRRRIDQVDELVKTLPYFTGNLTLVAKRKDLGSNCCPKKICRKMDGIHCLLPTRSP